MDVSVRNLVRERATACCEYCRLPERADPYGAFHVEHIVAKQHGGDDDIENLGWACSRCNHRKGTNLSSRDPETGATVELFHPRGQIWSDHFALRGARIIGKTAIGRATVRLLDMNNSRRIRLRRELLVQGFSGEFLILANPGRFDRVNMQRRPTFSKANSHLVCYAENSALPLSPYSTFHDAAVDAMAVLMAYTRTGDANLDGLVNDDDVTILGATYAPGVPNANWAMGDFDYNGFVYDDDVTLSGALYTPAAAAKYEGRITKDESAAKYEVRRTKT
jgi:hypothetical protein